MKQNYFGKLLFAGAFILSGSLYAQKTEVQKRAMLTKIMNDRRIADLQLSDVRETPAFIRFDNKTPLPRYQTQYQLSQYLSLKEGVDELRSSKLTHNKAAIDIQEYQQYFKGIPVEYAQYRALMKNENTLLATGSYFEIASSFSTHPALTERQALNFALAKVGATKYAWQQVEEMISRTTSASAKLALQRELKEYQPQGQLVIIKDFTKTGIAEMRLAYKFNIYAAEPLSRDWIYVDAQNGKILLRNAIIHHASVPATVPTRYAGNRVVYTKQVTGNDPNSGLLLVSSHPASEPTYTLGAATYILFDDTRGGSIQTYDLNNVGGAPISLPGIYTQGKSFTDVDNNWTLAEHKRSTMEGGAFEAENDDIAFDAHWGAEQVYDYWLKKHQRLSYDGKNAAIRSFIHYGPAYDNAFWNGSVMTYGDGSGNAATGFKALTSLDVCGHEIGHGVCSNTSDLVYEKESGAMNEALSDIWAACIENFAIDSVDGTLRTRYQPFYIGEQISFDANAPLRFMDNPKGAGNPDTYGGINWTNVSNCTPSLANDQCGVHNNSGVLNKWFYLLTVGSGLGSGPDAEWARTTTGGVAVDDGVNDNGGVYNVTGIGFELSEDITYMTEQLLTSTATYAEARSVSIAVATALSGNPCSSLVQSVTNAWFGVGVGAAFVAPCVVTYGFVQQPSTTVSEGSATSIGCNSQKTLVLPILTPAGGTTTVALGGTATLGDDYTVSTTSFSNNTTTTKTDSIVLNIKNDAVVEGTETILLTLNVTNVGSGSTNTSYTVNITDNDVLPTIGTDSVTLIDPLTTGAFNGADGLNDPAGFTETLEIPEGAYDPVNTNVTPNGKNQWGISNNQLAIYGKLVLGLNTGGTYVTASTSQTRIQTTNALDARGLNKLRISFDYTVQGEVDPATASVKQNGDVEYASVFDYMSIAYSLDGINFTEINTDSIPLFADLAARTGHFTAPLPDLLNNQQFYLAFRWHNDANAGGPTSVMLDNLSVKGLPKKIETTLNSYATENLVAGSDVYYYSVDDGDIIAKINKAGSFDYGCTSATVEKAGNGSFTFYTDATNSHIVGDKIIRLTPTTNNSSGTNTVSIYYTQAEINAIEAATNTRRTAFYLYKTTASSYTGATSANVELKPASYQSISANGTVIGGVFTANFTTGFSAFALGAPNAIILPVVCTGFTAELNGTTAQLQWKLASEVNNKYFEVERSMDGTSFTVIDKVQANAANRGLYTFADAKTDGLKVAYYRIRQYDADGRSTYICQTAFVRFNKAASLVIGNLYPNPVANAGYVSISADKAFRLQADFINVAGQTVRSTVYNVAAGNNNVQVLKAKLPAGTYMIRLTDGETGTLLKTQTFIQQ